LNRRPPQFLFVVTVAFLLQAIPGGSHAMAAAGEWQKLEFVEARLLSAVDGTGQLAHIPAGVELRLKDGWKTYWRSPGDAGLPPVLDWTGSTNFKFATLSYPRPHRFTLFNSQTFGYKDQVVFPVGVVAAEAGKGIGLKAKVDVLVCEKICVPQSLDLALNIPDGPATPSTDAQLLNRFQSQVPVVGAASGFEIGEVKTSEKDGKHIIEITAVRKEESFSAPDIIAEVEPAAAFGTPTVALTGGGHRATFTLPVTSDLPPGTSLAGRAVTLTLVDGDHASEHAAKILAGSGPGLGSSLSLNALMFAFALLGGLVLNLMPCVLPVLSLKLMSLVDHGDAPPARVRVNFLATAAGIVFSLMLIAATLIALKSAGLSVGWGIQFQQPVFIAAIAVIVALFACNMWGFFEIILPSSISNFAGTAGDGDSGVIGNFVIGAFATLLATPCSAPFVGTAVGFALAGGTAQILMIFFALGVGLALPYLAIAAFPSVARYIPRPGMWMVRLRQVLGLALAGTAIWLLSILPSQIGLAGTFAVAGLIGAMVIALASETLLPKLPHVAGRAVAAALALAAAGLPLVAKSRLTPVAQAVKDHGTIAWTAFDRDQIKSLVSQGKTVFVDVTADWCVVCQSNKKLVINTETINQRIGAAAVPMKADWTSPDPKISAFLSSFGRYGIPLNVVYGPGAPGGVLLPELLTQDAVLKAIDKASGKSSSSSLQPETPHKDAT
jgi:suppressor for copper-sensitivity B